MHSLRLESTQLILIGTRTTYKATGNAGNNMYSCKYIVVVGAGAHRRPHNASGSWTGRRQLAWHIHAYMLRLQSGFADSPLKFSRRDSDSERVNSTNVHMKQPMNGVALQTDTEERFFLRYLDQIKVVVLLENNDISYQDATTTAPIFLRGSNIACSWRMAKSNWYTRQSLWGRRSTRGRAVHRNYT